MMFWYFQAQALRGLGASIFSLLGAKCQIRSLATLRPPNYEEAKAGHTEGDHEAPELSETS